MNEEPKTVQRTGAGRFAQRRIQRHRRLTPVADLTLGAKPCHVQLFQRMSQTVDLSQSTLH